MSIKRMLQEELESEMTELSKLEVGSEKYKLAVEGIAKLIDRINEIDKFEAEAKDKAESREIETELKREQMAEEKKDRRWKNGIQIGGIVLPTAVAVWGTLKSFKFEQTGTVTTILGRMHVSNLLKRK